VLDAAQTEDPDGRRNGYKNFDTPGNLMEYPLSCPDFFLIQKIARMLVIDSWIPRYLFVGFVSVFGAVLITFPGYGWSVNRSPSCEYPSQQAVTLTRLK